MLPAHKTKIVCTIGPASGTPERIEQLLDAGMNVARLNFSHGSFDSHARSIENLRAAARRTGRSLAILADLPGPKIRIGHLQAEPLELSSGADFELTTRDVPGDERRVSVSFEALARVLSPGHLVFLNDGVVQLEVCRVEPPSVFCRVAVGGELRSRSGVNLPRVDLGVSAFTADDRRCLEFALGQGVDAVSQSFVAAPEDVHAVRDAARELGHAPFVIAKIERATALDRVATIIDAADGIMIARGDLGVELPIENIPAVQKQLASQARSAGKPVITATQMLESMIHNPRPTRAEATDVANAILDGTDCVMLSGESAVGKYPVQAAAMLAKLAAAIEPFRPPPLPHHAPGDPDAGSVNDWIASSVASAVQRVSPAAVIVPTRTGLSARRIARFRLPVWIVAVSASLATRQQLQFSYGVCPVPAPEGADDWKVFARDWLRSQGLEGRRVVLTGGPSPRHPDANHRMEILELGAS